MLCSIYYVSLAWYSWLCLANEPIKTIPIFYINSDVSVALNLWFECSSDMPGCRPWVKLLPRILVFALSLFLLESQTLHLGRQQDIAPFGIFPLLVISLSVLGHFHATIMVMSNIAALTNGSPQVC